MSKSKKGSEKAEPVQDTQKLNARAYAARLAKQVSEDTRRTATPRKKPTA